MSGASFDVLGERFAALTSSLRDLAAERTAQEASWQQQRLQISEDRRRAAEPIERELAAVDADAAVAAAVAAARQRRERRLAAVADAAGRLRRLARDNLQKRLEAIRASDAAAARAKMTASAGRRAELLRGIADLRQRLQTMGTDIIAQSVAAKAPLPERESAARPEMPPGTDPVQAAAALPAQVDQAAEALARLVRGGPARNCRIGLRIRNHLLALLPAGALIGALGPADGWPWAVIALAFCQGGVVWLTAYLRSVVSDRLTFVRNAILDLGGRTDAVERLLTDPMSAPDRPTSGSILAASDERDQRQRDAQTAADRAMASVREREARLRTRIERGGAAAEAAAGKAAAATAAAARHQIQARIDALDTTVRSKQAQADAAWRATCDRLLAAATAMAGTVGAACAEAVSQVAATHPSWQDGAWEAWKPALAWPPGIPAGRIATSLASLAERAGVKDAGLAEAVFTAPLQLAFPGRGALVIRSGPEQRAAALDQISTVVLRCLTSCPAARVKLTIIDPVGLGQGFAPLLTLGDHGEAVLSGGIAADDARIERALEDLSAQVEAVIRNRLRGTYETIADYNREAGELQEPMRLVAIADFPSGFGERALERLGILLRSGSRCGVHLLVHHDLRHPLPPTVEAALLQHGALILRGDGSGFEPETPGLRGLGFVPEPAPSQALAARLVAATGAAAVKASRVEMPFAAVAPPPGQEWTLSTADRLRVPIGVRGAGKLQYLELGRGTAQHVLIGGRTGSGKSTLLHVLVTSAAQWFHPRELELHLIDFKKGVEFQAYAAHRLPHARVVAIESDREFGLSVLRRLDGELNRRGEAFRKAGAQDLASHRRSGGEYLPRILLLIDEFQELFTEDDAVARDAALLLDRFVRQGRAFGLHVVLGSQTLSGAYSLAKSSIGQMGVRIVLPCNEADANLLLHEDNDGARLLSRPGDGIYNDQAGLAEGNSPFQVCWLGEEEHARQLRAVAERTAADGWRPPVAPVIFAGDAPSRLEDEPQLAALLGRAPTPADRRNAAWIGLSSSLRGAAEVVFPAASGGNLLLAGQHREAAAATLAAIALGLAARHPVDGLRLLTLDGEDADGPFAALWSRLNAALPHGARRFGGREAVACLEEIAGILDRRQSGEDPARTPVLFTVFGLQRLRALRPDDDFASERASGEPPADRFARILAQGPELGIHAAVWCDSLSALQRGLGRRSLRDFDLRILFQMSGADSTELIDDDGASRLGLHNALIAALGDGRREKFRPYQAPDAEFLAGVGRALRSRPG